VKVFATILLIVVVLLAAFVGLAVWKPVIASRILWPVVENAMLRDPFVGITTTGRLESGLFAVEATGVSTRPVVDAANALIDSLSNEQRVRLLHPVDDLEWRRWANIHISTRRGVGLLEMNAEQESAAMDLLAASLSARGLETSRNIMRLEGHLADLKDDHDQYGEKRYWLTIMGEPSQTEPWGWQIDGHHLIINYFVLGDQVVMTPTFMGSEPTRADSGRFAGTVILEEELAAGLALINTLDAKQRAKAIVSADKTANNNRGELFQDNAVVPYAGIGLSELIGPQRELAVQLIMLHVGNMDAGHAQIKLAEVADHWDETRFAWVGDTAPDSVFYYRVHGPTLMIEYDHQTPVALDGPDVPSRNHVHTVVRTPNGNDYGKDLLGQHLELHPH